MPNTPNLTERERACLREARSVMNNVTREMAPEHSYNVTFDDQFSNARGLAVELGADRFRSCMTRQVAQGIARR